MAHTTISHSDKYSGLRYKYFKLVSEYTHKVLHLVADDDIKLVVPVLFTFVVCILNFL